MDSSEHASLFYQTEYIVHMDVPFLSIATLCTFASLAPSSCQAHQCDFSISHNRVLFSMSKEMYSFNAFCTYLSLGPMSSQLLKVGCSS